MSNAYQVARDTMTQSGDANEDDTADMIVDALDASGHLLPDLPEPTRWKQHEEPEWDALEEKIRTAGYEGRVIVEDGADVWESTAENIREYAYALLAAANYAEKHTKNP